MNLSRARILILQKQKYKKACTYAPCDATYD